MSIPKVEQLVEDYWQRIQLSDREAEDVRQVVLAEIGEAFPTAERDQRRARARLQRLGNERQKLMEAYYEGAIDRELLRSEQQRIALELAEAEATIQRLDFDQQLVLRRLDELLALMVRAHGVYMEAGAAQRILLNRAVFEAIYVDEDWDGDVVEARLTPTMRQVLRDAGRRTVDAGSQHMAAPGSGSAGEADQAGDGAGDAAGSQDVRDSSPADLPVNPRATTTAAPQVHPYVKGGRNGRSRRQRRPLAARLDLAAMGHPTARTPRLTTVNADNDEPRPSAEGRGSNLDYVVAGAGFEPATSGL